MTDCSMWIGKLEDPKFKWEGGDWNGNTPRSISPDFPPPPNHYNADFHSWVKKTGVEYKQTDWGAYVAKVSRKQIEDFIDECYRGKESLPWVEQDLKALREFVKTLGPRKTYALVATEF